VLYEKISSGAVLIFGRGGVWVKVSAFWCERSWDQSPHIPFVLSHPQKVVFPLISSRRTSILHHHSA
jgi:hypothetical protein